MSEKFNKENDYIVSLTLESESTSQDSFKRTAQIKKIFNFLSAQVITIYTESMGQERGYNTGGSDSVSTQMVVQNFSDLDSIAEIEMMHRKLKSLGRSPPALEKIVRYPLSKPKIM